MDGAIGRQNIYLPMPRSLVFSLVQATPNHHWAWLHVDILYPAYTLPNIARYTSSKILFTKRSRLILKIKHSLSGSILTKLPTM